MPVAEVVDLHPRRDLAPGLDEHSPVGQLLLPAYGQVAIAVPVQPVLPGQAVPQGHERQVDRNGDAQAVGGGDGTLDSGVPCSLVPAVPSQDDGVPFDVVVPGHPPLPDPGLVAVADNIRLWARAGQGQWVTVSGRDSTPTGRFDSPAG